MVPAQVQHVKRWRSIVSQVSQTFDLGAAQKSYYGQLFPLNPSGIVPVGPTAEDLGLRGESKKKKDAHKYFIEYNKDSLSPAAVQR
jgi:glutathionyl-hydroquinone reductase